MGKRLRHDAWWRVRQDDIPQEVNRRLAFLVEQNRELLRDNAMYIGIASNGNPDGSSSYGSEVSKYRYLGLKMRKNLCTALVETAASIVAANRTIPAYMADGDFALAMKAEQKAKVLHSQMWNLQAFDYGIEAFFDAAIVGTGLTAGVINPDTGLPQLVRVSPNSVFIDQAEGRNPRSLYWVHFVPREYLQGLYPSSRFDIEDAQGPTAQDYDDYYIRQDNEADLVRVVEAWHLPSSSKAKDGLHVVTTSNALLAREPHTRQRFPFAAFHYARRRAGWWGQGLLERALPAQIRHWQLQQVIDKCQDLGSNLVYLIDSASEVEVKNITNVPGTAIYYDGARQKPEAVTWQGTPQDLVAEQQRIWGDLLEQEGLSAGTAGGELPQKGLTSGRAVRAADDVTNRRQVIAIRSYEAYFRDLAQVISDLNDDCVALDPNYEVQGFTRSGRAEFLKSSRWADLEIPEGNCKLTVMSMSAVPTSPAAKLQAVAEYTEAGYLTKDQALSLIEFPANSAWASLETAQLDLVESQISDMREGREQLPIPQQIPYLEQAKTMVNNAFLIAYRTNASEDVQRLFLDYLDYCDQLVPPAPPMADTMPPEGEPPMDPNTPPMAA